VIDPLERWRELGLPDKPDYAGLLTFSGVPYTQDPAELAGIDVAIVGAPTDDLVSDRPGTRFGPRAIRAAGCPPGAHLEAKVDWNEELRVVDFGDAPVLPADPARTHTAIERIVAQVVTAGAIPIVLGGDHSIVEPGVKAVAASYGPVGLVHFDTHTDTGTEVFDVEISHGTPMYRLVRDSYVDPKRYVQIGLRGYWPGEREFGWQPPAINSLGGELAWSIARSGSRLRSRRSHTSPPAYSENRSGCPAGTSTTAPSGHSASPRWCSGP
jgi:arginase family enzyme